MGDVRLVDPFSSDRVAPATKVFEKIDVEYRSLGSPILATCITANTISGMVVSTMSVLRIFV